MPYRPALSLCLILRPESLLCNVSKTLFHSLNSATPTTLIIGQPLIQIILVFTGSCFTMYSITYCSIILRVNNEYLTLVWAIKNERVKIIGFISKIMHIMGVLIRGLLTHLVEMTSTRQCCVLWDYCVVVMAESQEHSSEIADKVVNEDASTLTCLCC